MPLPVGWLRGRICEIGKASCNVWLIDVGKMVAVKAFDIYELDAKFMSHPEVAILCSLNNIVPSAGGYEWPTNACDTFNRLAQNGKLQVVIDSRDNHQHRVSLYAVRRNCNICINGLLVRYNAAQWIGTEPLEVEDHHQDDHTPTRQFDLEQAIVLDRSIASTHSTCSRGQTTTDAAAATAAHIAGSSKNRSQIKVVHIISPGEFYVSQQKQVTGIEKMHIKIQQLMIGHSLSSWPTGTKWMTGAHCLVYCSDSKFGAQRSQWYRGRITEITVDKLFFVFLMDRGSVVEVQSADCLVQIPTDLEIVGDGAIRCHMACVKPMTDSTKWPLTVIDEFRNACDRYSMLGVSVQGNRVGNSCSVILWGMRDTSDDPFMPNTCEWVNINETMVHGGYVHLVEPFQPIALGRSCEAEFNVDALENFEEWLQRIMAVTRPKPIVSDDAVKFDCTLKIGGSGHTSAVEILEWSEAEPVNKQMFVGTPTYVDNNCVIYMYDTTVDNVLVSIKYALNAELENSLPPTDGRSWKVGAACIARYHLDNKFYRAKIMRIEGVNEYKVRIIEFCCVLETHQCRIFLLFALMSLFSVKNHDKCYKYYFAAGTIRRLR